MAEPFMMQDLENATTTVRTANNNGYPEEDPTWRILIQPTNWMESFWGRIFLDNNQEWYEDNIVHDEPLPVLLAFDDVIEPLSIEVGNTVTLTYDGGQKLVVYLPAIGVELEPDVWLYVATDGSTYYDAALTQLARGVSAFHIEASMVLRQYAELEASAVFRWWKDLLTSATLRIFGRKELKATCFLMQRPPEIPVGLTALDMKKGDSVLLDWDENAEPNVLYYKIYKRDNAEWIFVGQAEKPPYQVGGLLKDTEYWFAITAVVVKGIEEFLSNIVYNNDGQVVRSIAEEVVEIEVGLTHFVFNNLNQMVRSNAEENVRI